MAAKFTKPAFAALMVGIGVHTSPLFACAPEAFPGQLIASYAIKPSKSPLLIAVRHAESDLKLQYEGAVPFWVNSPGGRDSADFIAIAPGSSPGAMLCIFSMFANVAPPRYSISEYVAENLDATEWPLLQTLNTAGSEWYANTADSVKRSAGLYRQLAIAGIDKSFPAADLDFYLPYFQAISQAKIGERSQPIADLYGLAKRYERRPEFAYKALASAGSWLLAPASVSEGINTLNQALEKLAMAHTLSGQNFAAEKSSIEANLGEGFTTAARLPEADAALASAVKDAGSDFVMLAMSLSNRGYLSNKRSEMPGVSAAEREQILSRSTEDHLQAIYFASQARYFDMLQLIESNMAVQYARVGERRKSLVHFNNVLKLLGEIDNPGQRAHLLSTLGDYSQILGDYQKSISYLEESLRLTPDVATASPRNFNLYCRLGTLYRHAGRINDALASHQQCLAVATRVNDLLSVVEAQLQISTDYDELENLPGAISASTASIDGLEKLTEFNIRLRAWTQYASVMLKAGKLEQAESAIAKALTAESDQRRPDDQVRALAVALQIAVERKAWDQATRYGEQAATLIDLVHAELEAEQLGPAWSNATDFALSELASFYLSRYEMTNNAEFLDKAFITAERGRDASLRHRLGVELSNDVASLEEKNRLDVYSKISKLLADAGSRTNVPAMMQLNYYHQHDVLSLSRLQHVPVAPLAKPLSLKQVQKQLKPDQLVLYYLMTDRYLHIIWIDRDKVKAQKINRDKSLDSFLASAGLLLNTPDSFSASQLSSMAEKLLPGLDAFPAAREILIASHTGLYALPFAAMSLGSDKNYVPLGQRYALVNVPSLSIYFMEKPRREIQYTADVAVLADPLFKSTALAAVGANSKKNDYLRDWSDSLTPLPFTAQEARNIKSVINGTAVTFTGSDANRNNLNSPQVRNAHVLHIATHGYFKSTSEDNVGLALSMIDGQGNSDPGFITLSELFGYAFNNELVVISGCDTAMGKKQAGVGLNSLSRGFLAQGVKHVIATLWPVSDRASAEFMRLFYNHLNQSRDVATSLKQAQLDLSRNPSYRNPYYWAGYVLTSVSPDSIIGIGK